MKMGCMRKTGVSKIFGLVILVSIVVGVLVYTMSIDQRMEHVDGVNRQKRTVEHCDTAFPTSDCISSGWSAQPTEGSSWTTCTYQYQCDTGGGECTSDCYVGSDTNKCEDTDLTGCQLTTRDAVCSSYTPPGKYYKSYTCTRGVVTCYSPCCCCQRKEVLNTNQQQHVLLRCTDNLKAGSIDLGLCPQQNLAESYDCTRRPHDILTGSALTKLFNMRVTYVERWERALAEWIPNIGWISHSGVVVTTTDGKRWLIHKGANYGEASDTVVVDSRHMSSAWQQEGDQHSVTSSRVTDYVRVGGEKYNLCTNNCHIATNAMLSLP